MTGWNHTVVGERTGKINARFVDAGIVAACFKVLFGFGPCDVFVIQSALFLHEVDD